MADVELKGFWMVRSRSKPGAFHAVSLTANDRWMCDCKAYQYSKNGICRHITRVMEETRHGHQRDQKEGREEADA